MTFQPLEQVGLIEHYRVAEDEIRHLLKLARRDMKTARELMNINLDWALIAAYNAALNQIEWAGTVYVGVPAAITFQAVANAGTPNGTVIVNTAVVDDDVNPPFARTATTVVTVSTSEVLTYGERDIKRNWRTYRENYEREMGR